MSFESIVNLILLPFQFLINVWEWSPILMTFVYIYLVGYCICFIQANTLLDSLLWFIPRKSKVNLSEAEQ